MLCLSDFVWFLIRRSKMKLFIDKLKNHIYWLKISSGLYDGMDDETFLKMAYKRKFGKELDLNNPVTFNEKLQWLKLNDRKPEYTEMVDKFMAKKYVAKKHQDYSNNHILLIYLMSGKKSTLKNTRKTKIKQSKSYLTYGFLNRSYIITKK